MTLEIFSDKLIKYGYVETINRMTTTYRKGITTISYTGDDGIITMTIGTWIRYGERYSGFDKLYERCEDILLIVKLINRKERIKKIIKGSLV